MSRAKVAAAFGVRASGAFHEGESMAFVRQNEVLGKTVIGADGNRVGDVKEVAFSLQGELGFVVQGPNGDGERTIPFSAVQAVGDFIVLRPDGSEAPPARPQAQAAPTARAPPAPAAPPAPIATTALACGKCGKTPKAGARFCNHCGEPVAAAGA